MRIEELLRDVLNRLDKMTIYEVRQIAREVRAHVTSGQKAAIIESINAIATGVEEPSPASKRGAPPKSDKYDVQLVTDVLECREYYLAKILQDNRESASVSDPEYEYSLRSDREYEGYLYKDGENFVLFSDEKVFVPELFVTKYALRAGDKIRCRGRKKSSADYAGLYEIISINGLPYSDSDKRERFKNLTRVYPAHRIVLSSGETGGDAALRITDLFAPVALGQRRIIASPPNCGKTTLLKSIARGIYANYRDFEVVILTLGARPEEVTDFLKSGENRTVFYTSFEKPDEEHLLQASLAFEYAKRCAELKKNVFVLADGLYENLPDGVIKSLLSCALCAEEGGSLTVIAALPPAANFAGIANSVTTLSPALAAQRIFPAIDLRNTYSGREETLLSEEELKISTAFRQKLSDGTPDKDVINCFNQTKSNRELTEFI